MKSNQYNHKIIRAFFKVEKEIGFVPLRSLEKLCKDESQPNTYVPTFGNNYAQMKSDGEKTHGKVFEDDGMNVVIWKEVKSTLEEHRHYFGG